ncbi:MarR family transcriptional regulator [Brevundimonas sp. Leaf363]|uniref:MarR family winged helix-turn-helix transcriptional regulator n=1 Tax=Brevundimonas sp. Leaf363 TaxID=1736353 RepID=UPI000700EEEB|nr:MarR family winged helix-turn-helix transcriptional regulator [Brevundimonas sp. Leaf363]KQS57219.1 MarR family transcriptional regulator [Brevundimonas sp. Leaf363]
MSKAVDFSAYQTTLAVKDACLCLHTQRAARVLARRFDEAMRRVGLTSGQFSLLNGLNRPQAPTLGAVADLLAMDRTTVTANLKPLERRGLLTLSVDGADRRIRRASLTDAGRALLGEATVIWRREHGVLEEELEGAAPRLREDLRKVA